jgi:hypothetical protein
LLHRSRRVKRAVVALALAILLLAAPAPALALKGCADTNKDGVVNSIDAFRILQYVAGLYDPGIILLHSWDPDGSGAIQSRDATIVLQYEAALLSELPGCP